MEYNAIRFINQAEKNVYDKEGIVKPVNQFKAWSNKRAIFAFVINGYYKLEDYIPVAEAIMKYNRVEYDYIVYLKLPENTGSTFAAYDVSMFTTQLDKFDIDTDAYDTGPIYVIPEYRISHYRKKFVVDIKKVEEVAGILKENREAINKMPENKIINLGLQKDESEQMTFMKMYMELLDAGIVDEDIFRGVISDIDFIEEVGFEYLGSDLQVGVTSIPVISEGDLNVKVVKIEQGNKIGLIVPSDVAGSYEKIEDNPDNLNAINQVEEISFETFGFDGNDKSLLELVSNIFVNSNNQALAYELTSEAKLKAEEEKKEESKEEDDFGDLGLGRDSSFGQSNQRMFDDLDTSTEDIEAIDDIEVNLESYKKFKLTSKALSNLEETLYKKVPKIVKENIKTKFIADNKVMLVEIDNKVIYESLNNLPDHARQLLTSVGEIIRTNPTTQMVDSISHKGRRIFILAESINNNYWVVKKEELKLLESKNLKTVVPKKEEIIELNRSNIRQESRAQRPYNHNGNIAFTDKFKKVRK